MKQQSRYTMDREIVTKSGNYLTSVGKLLVSYSVPAT